METRNTGALWLPPVEQIEALAQVLHSHWSAAKVAGLCRLQGLAACRASQPAQAERLFWPRTPSWVRKHAQKLIATGAASFATTLPTVAGSSGKHPDRRPY